MLFYSAQLRRPDQRITILFRERGWNLDLQIDALDHSGDRTVVDPLYNTDVRGRQATLSTKTEDINACACADGS
jgi:hypothetical protein